MGSRRNVWLSGIAAMAILLLSSCHTVTARREPVPGPGRGYGPPPHAQANGYRNKVVYGYELVYDSGCGLYVVVGMTDWYYHEGYFYRLRGDVWEISLRGDEWGPANHDSLPPGLRLKTRSVAKLNRDDDSVVKPNGNGNSIVKLNGNGNSLAKLNGNGNGNGNGKNLGKGRH